MRIYQVPEACPFCSLFLSKFLSEKVDVANFPPDDAGTFQRYEAVFESAIQILGLRPERLRRRPEFNFDSGNSENLESAIAVLRAVVVLKERGFRNIRLIKSGRMPSADIACERNGKKVCCEVKAITKQSRGRGGFLVEGQVYEKIRESIHATSAQLRASAADLQSDISIAIYVSNWHSQFTTLDGSALLNIVNKLEPDLGEIDVVIIIAPAGHDFSFFLDSGRSIAW